MDKTYDHKKTEEKIYRSWEENGLFKPEINPNGKPFSIILPPPNVTGTLHIGHAYEGTIQDIIVRYKRMNGFKALWVPGTDHAAIATQAKVEKDIYQKEGKSRYDLGRDEFIERVTQFALQSQKTILSQLPKMGFSLDWSRLAYTLDEKREKAVRVAFKKMFDTGLIYRDFRVVNWDPKGQTTVSDEEVIHKEHVGKLYTFRYDKDFPIPISSTRPETKLGDVAVAVHPKDKRYKKFVGNKYYAVFAGVRLKITIVSDDSVDPEFGTGAVGITPGHSMVDWELSKRHKLPLKQVINEESKIFGTGTRLDGKKTTEAREEIISWLKAESLLEKTEDTQQNLTISDRTGAVIEPLPKMQWFIDVDKEFKIEKSKLKGIPMGTRTTLKKIMAEAVKSGQIKIFPNQFEKRYFHWIDNLRDWCISRQIWFGHRIPAWSCENNHWIVMEGESPKKCPNCKSKELKQDQDTLDTWFSSGLWTFSTLGWPDETKDLKTYHPTDLMDPGYEILFLWVSRMILFSGFLLGDIPFKKVAIHGMVRDSQGRKFSKSSGIGGDPLDVTSLYGADALRMALVSNVTLGNDPVFDIQRVKGMRNFANKLWNIARFIYDFKPEDYRKEISGKDREMLGKTEKLTVLVTDQIEKFRLHEAAQLLYDFTWHEFADKYIEEAKSRRGESQYVLELVFSDILKLLHPFMPFITEEIYQRINPKAALMIEKWPLHQTEDKSA